MQAVAVIRCVMFNHGLGQCSVWVCVRGHAVWEGCSGASILRLHVVLVQ